MAEITKRETRNRGERRPVVVAAPTSRTVSSTLPKSLKRKSPGPPPAPEPLRTRDPPYLPSSNTPQETDLPGAQWKGIAERQGPSSKASALLSDKHSAVLAASLKQSMEKWRDGGCFEKYWVKNPAKKAHRDFQNPPTQSMVRLGSAALVIEPHSFEVILYSVRAVMPKPAAASAKTTPIFNGTIPPYKPIAQSPATPQRQLASNKSQTTPASLNIKPSPGSSIKPSIETPGSLQKPSIDPSSSTNNTPKQTQQPPNSDPSSNNPVIKELALRASQNVALKDLMKTVAAGGASEPQLKEFQRHIDDINAMLRRKGIEEASSAKPKAGSGKKQASNETRQNQPVWTQPITPNIKSESGARSQQAPVSNPKPRLLASSSSEISAMVFEIINGTGDRYLIPKSSLLEFADGNRLAILSFLVHLKGINANGGFYENDKDYCELITFKLIADRPAILDPLRRAVDPPASVRKQMQDWADKMTVAAKAWLILRIRSNHESEESRVEQATPMTNNENLPVEYEAPDSLFPLHRSTVAASS